MALTVGAVIFGIDGHHTAPDGVLSAGARFWREWGLPHRAVDDGEPAAADLIGHDAYVVVL